MSAHTTPILVAFLSALLLCGVSAQTPTPTPSPTPKAAKSKATPTPAPTPQVTPAPVNSARKTKEEKEQAKIAKRELELAEKQRKQAAKEAAKEAAANAKAEARASAQAQAENAKPGKPENAADSPVKDREHNSLLERIFQRKNRTAPEKIAAEATLTPSPTIPVPIRSVKKSTAGNPSQTDAEPAETPARTKPVEPTPNPKPAPEVQGLEMGDVPTFVNTPEEPTPTPSPLLANTTQAVARLRELRKTAREDAAVAAALSEADTATTEPEFFAARKKYLMLLYSKIRELDPALTDLAQATEAASITRLESRRESMRTLFEAGQKPDTSKE